MITHQPARYRDPDTGLPFFNRFAYEEIQRLKRGDYRFSQLLGAWAGSGVWAAAGVPERFLNPDAPGPEKKEEKKEQEEKGEEKVKEGKEGDKHAGDADADATVEVKGDEKLVEAEGGEKPLADQGQKGEEVKT